MISQSITIRTIESAKSCRGRDVYIWDSALRGYGLRVTPKGVKSYFLQYQVIVGLGQYVHLASRPPDTASHFERSAVTAPKRDEPIPGRSQAGLGVIKVDLRLSHARCCPGFDE